MAMERKQNDTVTCDIADHLTVIAVKENGWSKEFNLVSWNGQQPPKFDIREWSPDHTKMSKGITLYDYEMRKICNAYMKFCNARTVSEGRNNRNAAAEAGMRAGEEAAKQQEEAEREDFAEAGMKSSQEAAIQRQEAEKEDFDEAEIQHETADTEASPEAFS